MSTLAFVYALLAGLSMAVLAIGLRLAAPGIHPALGIAIVTGIAFLVNVVVALAMRATTGAPLSFSLESLYVLTIVGVATAGVNLFTLFAYASGLRITSSFIIGGTSTVLMLVVDLRYWIDRGRHLPTPAHGHLAERRPTSSLVAQHAPAQ
jgi:uncharacterized membrane protein